MDDEQKRISQTGVRVFSTQDIALEILMILEKNRIPIYKLDEVLDQVKKVVLEQPISIGTVGLTLSEYEKNQKRIRETIAHHKKLIDEWWGK